MTTHIVLLTIQVCEGKVNATHMECRAPALPGEHSDDKTENGEISFRMDGARLILNKTFDYHPDAAPIPFENEERVLYLSEGNDEVSMPLFEKRIQYKRALSTSDSPARLM